MDSKIAKADAAHEKLHSQKRKKDSSDRKVGNEIFDDAKYFEWHNPVIEKYQNGELTEYELVNELFEPFEQVSQMQAQLLEASFGLMTGGPAQAHVGTGGGGSSSDMHWGEKNKHGGRRR